MMGCGIYVFRKIIRVTGGEGELWLQGTALDCTGVQVSLEGVAAEFVEFIDGYWRARFDDRDLTCGSTIELSIVVACLPGGTYAESPYVDKLPFVVDCVDIDCPPKPAQGISVEYCYNDTSETRFSIQYDPPLPPGTYATFRVSDGVTESNTSPSQALNGLFTASLTLTPGPRVVLFEIVGRPTACASQRIEVPGCDCTQDVTLELLQSNGEVVGSVSVTASGTTLPCVDPASGPYSIRAVLTPNDSDRSYFWYVNGATAPVETDAPSLEGIALAAGELYSARMEVRQPGCNDIQVELRVEGCPVAPPPCPQDFRVEVRAGDEGGGVVFAVVSSGADPQATPPTFVPGDSASPCLPPGNYAVVVATPSAAGLRYEWTGTDGRPVAGAETHILPYEILPDGTRDGTVGVVISGAGGLCLSPNVAMRACPCPEALAIRFFDVSDAASPREVGDGECLTPGPYEARAEGASVADSSFEWTRNGRATGIDGSVHPVDVKSVLKCGGAKNSDVSLTVTARPRTNPGACAPTASYAGDVCPQFVFCIECWLLRLLLVSGIGLFTMAIVFALCPGVCDVTVLRWLARKAGLMQEYRAMSALWGVWAGIFTVSFTVTRIVIVLAGLAIIPFLLILKLYVDRCRPTWCFDWFPLIWQSLLIAGLLCLFYASCPTCIPMLDGTNLLMLVPGILLTGVGLILWMVWAFGKCQIPWCRALFELASVGLVPKAFANGIILLVLAPCVWAHGGWILLAFDFFFFVIMVAAVICFTSDRSYNLVSRGNSR